MGQSWAGSSCHLGTKNHPKQSLSSCHSTLRAVWKFREIDEFLEVKLCSCPRCGGTQFKDQNAIEQIIEDIPPVRPHVTRLTTYHATCVGCGQTVRSQHPLSTAADHRPSVQPVCSSAHEPLLWRPISTKPKAFPCEKPAPFCAICFNLQLSPGGLSQAMDRLASKVKPQYDALAIELRQAPALHNPVDAAG
jgi:hypothetical protein